jgi:hypothetical protein
METCTIWLLYRPFFSPLIYAREARRCMASPTPPLEMALRWCNREYQHNVVRKLIEKVPELLTMKSKCEWLPLVSALQRNYGGLALATEAWITIIVKHCPEAASSTGDRNKLPLHMVCFEGSADFSLALVNMILEAFPEAAERADKDGNLQLHNAARGNGNEVLSMIAKAFPEALEMKDKWGQAPLLQALMNVERCPYILRLAVLAHTFSGFFRVFILKVSRCKMMMPVFHSITLHSARVGIQEL